MLSNLAAALITHGRIETTLTKAKQAAAMADQKDAIHLRRIALSSVRDETAVTLLFNEKHKEFAGRPGGYTRIYKLGRRISDAAELALIEFVKADDPGYKKSKGRKSAKSAKAKVKAAPVAPAAEPAAVPTAPEAKG